MTRYTINGVECDSLEEAQNHIDKMLANATPIEKIIEHRSLSKQVSGSHYKNFKIQPIEFIHKNNLDYIQGNIIKYVCRYKDKNGVEDLEKAKHYIEMLIDFLM